MVQDSKSQIDLEILAERIYEVLNSSNEIKTALQNIKNKNVISHNQRIRLITILKNSDLSLHIPYVEICENVECRPGIEKEARIELSKNNKNGRKTNKSEAGEVVFMEW